MREKRSHFFVVFKEKNAKKHQAKMKWKKDNYPDPSQRKRKKTKAITRNNFPTYIFWFRNSVYVSTEGGKNELRFLGDRSDT